MSLKTQILLSRIIKTLGLISERFRRRGIVKGKIVRENLPNNKILKLFYAQYQPILHVGESNENFSCIQDAVKHAVDTPKFPVTIKISNGVYDESIKIRGGRYISIEGADKENCILQSDGDYWNPPLEIAGNSSISDMTIIALKNKLNKSSLPSYAIHHDYSGEGKSLISNCKIISQQHSAIGIGLHNNQTLTIDKCELFSDVGHALYAHNRSKNDAEYQRLIVKESVIESLTGSPILLEDANHRIGGGFGDKKDTEFGFYSNNFISGDLDVNKFLKYLDPPLDDNCLVGYIKLTSDSHSNNIVGLNATQEDESLNKTQVLMGT